MSEHSPESTVASFVEAVNRGDLEAALRHYEDEAVFAVQPGVVVSGRSSIREALGGMLTAQPRIVTDTFKVIREGDIALYHSRWSMSLAGGASESGVSADVLRMQTNGEWKIAIDNPWGASVLTMQHRESDG